MGTITQIAEQMLADDYRPEEFAELLKNPVNFKQFQKALLDAAELGGFKAEGDMLENEQIPDEIKLTHGKREIRSLSPKGQKKLAAFLEEKLCSTDPDGNWDSDSQKKKLRRWVRGENTADYEAAVTLCFALGLNDEESAKFITAGNVNLRAFNPRSASETAYFFCLALGRSYEDARSIIRDYQKGSIGMQHADKASFLASQTITLARALEEFDTLQASSVEAISQYLEDNRSSFSGASRAAWNTYIKCKANLYFDLIARRPQDFLEETDRWLTEMRDDLKAFGVDEALCETMPDEERTSRLGSEQRGVDLLIEKIRSVASDSEDKNALASLRRCWGGFVVAFKKARAPWKLVQGHAPGSMLMPADKALDAALRLGADWRKRDHEVKDSADAVVGTAKWERAAKESSLPWRSDGVRMRWFFEGFPRKKYLQDLEKSEGKEVSPTQARKAIVIFYFLDYSIRWAESRYAKRESKINCAENPDCNPFANERDKTPFGYDDFISEYEGLNALLWDCQLSLLYPADPCDLLVMKSIRAYDPKYSDKTVNPIKYFNMTVKSSFEDGEDD